MCWYLNTYKRILYSIGCDSWVATPTALAFLLSQIDYAWLLLVDVFQPISRVCAGHHSHFTDVRLRRQEYMDFTRSSICNLDVFIVVQHANARYSVQKWGNSNWTIQCPRLKYWDVVSTRECKFQDVTNVVKAGSSTSNYIKGTDWFGLLSN
jgi:hypothetical protein